MRLDRSRPLAVSRRRCSLAVGALTPSLSAMNTEHTPSATRSPSRWGGKWATGSRSHSRTARRLSFARTFSTSTSSTEGVCQLAKCIVNRMRVAVLSDIHGVLPALEAVLAEPAVRAADRIVLTGDHAAGPMPVETIDALAELGDRAVWVRGNADRELVQLRDGGETNIPD